MSTTDHKHTVTTQTASTIAIDTRINQSSINEAVQQAIADTTRPSEAAILADSTLPKVDIPGIGRGALHFQDSSPADSGKGGDHTDPLSSLAASLTAARSRLDALDPTNQQDPTHKPDLVGGSLPSATELRDQLASLLGIPASALASDPRDSKNQSSGSHHPERPDGPPDGDPAGTHDPNHAKVEGMLSAGSSGSDSWDVKDKHGHVHHGEDHWDGKGNEVLSDKDTKTGTETVTIFHADHSTVQRTTDPHHGTVTTTTTSADGSQTTTVAITDKKFWPDGTVTISQTKPGDPPLEPLQNDGNSAGGGAKMPDEEHQSVLPGWLRDEVHKELQAEIKSMHLPTHEGDNINVRDDVPGTVSQGDLKGATADKFHNILGGDTFDNAGIWQDSGTGVGSLSPNYNGPAGAIDPGPNDDQPVQTSGREERNTQHQMHTDPTAHGNGNQTGGQGTGATADHSPAGLIETAAQQAADKLQDAVGQGHDDPWGTQGRYEQAMSAPASPAETPAQKAAHQLQDALDQHDGPSQHEPIKPHEKVPGPDLGQGPGHSGNAHVDAASGFADLIRAAQNPKEFGLNTAAHSAAPDSTLHLAVNADFAGHGLGPHGVEDAHVAAAVPVAVHDIPLDHHSVAAPVVDHIAVAHH